jgi:hypothetical protein
MSDEDDKLGLDDIFVEMPDGREVTATVALDELTARKGFRPQAWQSGAPETGKSTRLAVGDSEELQRVLGLARRPVVVPGSKEEAALIRVVTRRHAWVDPTGKPCSCAEILERHMERPRACITALNLAQAWGLYEIPLAMGLSGLIGVGHGKTILDILAGMALPGCENVALLVPPTLVNQLIREWELVSQHFKTPNIIVHGKVKLPRDPAPRDFMVEHEGARATRVWLHVYPYSRLSRPDSSTRLTQIDPTLIVADEGHRLRHADTATTSRVFRRLSDQPDRTRFCWWSGSPTDGSLKDYDHLMFAALRQGSPLPTEREVTEDWCRALDPKKVPDEVKEKDPYAPWHSAAPMGALEQLCEEGEHVSEGFHRRLVQTLGVVSTTDAAVSAELCIEEQRPRSEVPREIEEHLRVLRETWRRPDGEVLLDAMSVARTARELACGFHYYWFYPEVNGQPQDAGLIMEWLEIRKDYRSEVRSKLFRRLDHLDSPHLVELAAMRHHGDIKVPEWPGERPCEACAGTGIEIESCQHRCKACHGTGKRAPCSKEEWEARHPEWDSLFWPAWRDIKGRVVYETRASRLDPYLAQDAADWARENRGIVWYESAEFGKWIAQLSGLAQHTGGPDAAALLARETGERSIICSIKAHGTGRDGLQRLFDDQLVAQPPASPTNWEQLLGRLHRIGQTSPRVWARFYRHTPELRDHVDRALARALYVQTTIGSSQKLLRGFVRPEAASAAPIADFVDAFDDADPDGDWEAE